MNSRRQFASGLMQQCVARSDPRFEVGGYAFHRRDVAALQSNREQHLTLKAHIAEKQMNISDQTLQLCERRRSSIAASARLLPQTHPFYEHIFAAIDLFGRAALTSACGPKRTCQGSWRKSAAKGRADIPWALIQQYRRSGPRACPSKGGGKHYIF
jgi:hypothetical protein